MLSPIDVMRGLIDQLLIWDHSYYVKNTSLVSDAVYDSVFQKLQELEKQYPEHIQPNSPTQKVSGGVSEEFRVVKHTYPMLSIKTETEPSLESLTKWMQSIAEKLNAPLRKVGFSAEHKYDGLGLSLKYSKGKLVQALTRGDGFLGEDVLANAVHVHGIPAELKPLDFETTCNIQGNVAIDRKLYNYDSPNFIHEVDLEIRGEVVMFKSDFEKLNEYQRQNGFKEFANTRNAAAGTLRTLDSSVVIKRHLRFLPYSLEFDPLDPNHELTINQFMYQTEVLKAFPVLGFIPPGEEVTNFCRVDPEDYYNLFLKVQEKRQSLPYEIDGLVFKVDDESFRTELGFRNREPVWAIAYKFPPEEVTTNVLGIDVQVGRTGKLTPVARLKSVKVGGVTVTNVTLHNRFDLRKRDVRVGDMVIVRRAGDVIPEIVGPLKDQRNWYYDNFKFTNCPVCGSKAVRLKGEREYQCMNKLGCSAQAKRAIEHYASRSAMRIEGLGEVMIDKLYEADLVTKLSDIYTLTVDKLTDIGVGKKIAENLIESIEKSKTTTFAKFIYALGIPNVGEGTSTRLANHYHHVYQFMTDQTNYLLGIPDIGPITTESIVRFFKDLTNMGQASHLFVNVLKVEVQQRSSVKLAGKTFVVTGSFEGFDRDGMKDLIKVNGGNVTNNVNKKVHYLVQGDNPGSSKVDKAMELKVPVIDIHQLNAMIG